MNPVIASFRPKTLTAALVPCCVATAFAYAVSRNVDWSILAFGLLSAFCIQIATNLLNDAFDHLKGADREDRKGPKRLIQMHQWTPQRVLLLGSLFLLLALLAGIPLVVKGGWPIVLLGLVSLFLAYGYTSGPLPLAYLGLGDLFVILFFGLFAVQGMIFLQLGQWPVEGWILGLQIGLLATTLIAINNFRDSAEDARANKRTLAVRFGAQFSRIEILICAGLPLLLGGLLIVQGHLWAGLLPLLLLPLVVRFAQRVWVAQPSPSMNSLLGEAARLHLLFGVLQTVGFFLS